MSIIKCLKCKNDDLLRLDHQILTYHDVTIIEIVKCRKCNSKMKIVTTSIIWESEGI